MRLGDTKFFNLFALIATNSSRGRTLHQWEADGVSWSRERFSRQGPGYTVQVEIHILRHRGKRGWTLLSVHEIWWDEAHRDAFRNARWVHLVKGARADVIKWFGARQASLDNGL